MREEMKKLNMNYPQVLDDNYAYWKALGNTYWPSFYIIDKQGIFRGYYFGETHQDDSQAKKIEAVIAALIADQK